MVIVQPHLEYREKMDIVSIAAHVSMDHLADLGVLFSEIFPWLAKKEVELAGSPFYRYKVFYDHEMMDIEVGVPVNKPVIGDDRIAAGNFPAGQYVVLVYEGNYSGLRDATAGLLDWAEEQGIEFQTSNDGREWKARIEFSLTDPSKEPDPQKWQTELAILTKSSKS
jgi:effector-binding domain-containing protein